MALAPILCAGPCGKVISIATKIVAVDDSPWCVDCADKREGKTPLVSGSTNPCTDVEITFITQCLIDAGWLHYGPEKAWTLSFKNMWLHSVDLQSHIWYNDCSANMVIVEIFEHSQEWKLYQGRGSSSPGYDLAMTGTFKQWTEAWNTIKLSSRVQP